jgi:hypothetical protein
MRLFLVRTYGIVSPDRTVRLFNPYSGSRINGDSCTRAYGCQATTWTDEKPVGMVMTTCTRAGQVSNRGREAYSGFDGRAPTGPL